LTVAFGMAFLWSVAVQVVGAFAYDVTGWNARTGYLVQQAAAETPLLVFDEDEARRQASQPGVSVRLVSADVDQKAFRDRLWSVADSQLVFYAARFAASRQRKERMIANWLRLYLIDDADHSSAGP